MAESISVLELHRRLMTEIESGEGLSLSAAGRLYPAHRGSGTLDPSTVFRWVTKGLRAPDGRLVKLEAVRVGGRWLTSRGALSRFISSLTPVSDPATMTNAPRSPAALSDAANAAGRALEKFGA